MNEQCKMSERKKKNAKRQGMNAIESENERPQKELHENKKEKFPHE